MNNNINHFKEVALRYNRRLPQIGDVYTHFKGMKIYITDLAYHTETEEPLVIYKHGNTTWARPLEMFLSEVDTDKYPNSKQYYRLERELPLNTKESIEFKELVTELENMDRFRDLDTKELETYILRHYYL